MGPPPCSLGIRISSCKDEKVGDNPLHPAEGSPCSRFSSDSCSFSKAGSRGEGTESTVGLEGDFLQHSQMPEEGAAELGDVYETKKMK